MDRCSVCCLVGVFPSQILPCISLSVFRCHPKKELSNSTSQGLLMASNPSCCLSLRSRPKARRDSWGLSLKTPKGTLNHPPGPVSARGSFSAQQFCLPGASGSPGFWRPWLSFGRLILLVPIYGDVSKPIVLCIYIIYIYNI